MEPREDTSLGESPETEEGLQKPKKARSEAQLKAFEKAREKRLESIKVKHEKISEKRQEINEIKKLKPNDVLKPQVVKGEAKPVKKEPTKPVEESESSSDESEVVIVRKSKHKKKPKKKVIIMEESSSDEEEEEPVVKPKKPSVPSVKRSTTEIIQPSPSYAPQYAISFV